MSDTDGLIFVGIAASAGGLEAASLLVQNLPISANAVYVMAQHMSPTHKSLLTSLISRETKLPVVELKDEITPEPDTIYITPPNLDVMVENGKISLHNPSGHPATPKPSADRLFKSIAADCGDRCVGIVLSGTGTDGSYGVQAIRESGGITIAQDTASAKYDGMPASAIETGCVDLTLTPAQMGQHLEKILSVPRDFDALRHINDQPNRLSELLQILLARTRIDFRDYKDNTINRRINRRMVALGIDDYESYVQHCRTSLEEVDALHRDLLISVTRFFRDPRQFEQLAEEVRTLARNRQRQQLRIWVAGCATGEEAYSLAILISEALGGPEVLEKNSVQIFATDIDERALEVARKGVYPITAAQDIPPQYLERYFTTTGGNLVVSPEIRAITLFSKHNIFQDPPFINVDLVTLRNVLIYFNALLQERVLNRIHYALSPGGLLFLGTSETVGALDVQFEARAGADKIYSKRNLARRDGVAGFMDQRRLGSSIAQANSQTKATNAAVSEAEIQMFDALAKSVAPNGFIAMQNSNIVRVFGDITPIMQLTEDTTLTLNTRILRAGLRDEAPSLISMAAKAKIARGGRWHKIAGLDFNEVRLVCYPIINPNGENHFLMAMVTRTETDTETIVESLSDKERTKYILQIENEMQSTREALQQTVEELQTSNEELQAVNEEMQSTNEELQSTNEELETSNEELQSTNEELITVNEEMQINSSELQSVTIELSAVLNSTPYPVLVVDQALIIRRASTQALEFFEIEELPQTGMHLSLCRLPDGFPSITKSASEVFRLREPLTVPVEEDGKKLRMDYAPFSDSMGTMLGMTLSIIRLD
ncbi:CheR family methyltransferase [Ascidiaceihabitans donghaensis]|nr:CheR family methyltransferase [Ascidiaceihabitans donghaensis]